jgi:hypothetical protein
MAGDLIGSLLSGKPGSTRGPVIPEEDEEGKKEGKEN